MADVASQATTTAASVAELNATADVPSLPLNPGPYDELHRKCREVFPMCFEGAKVMLQKGLSNNFQVTHTISISKALMGYRFGATYVGEKHMGPGESYPVLLGDMDPNGNTSATVIHQFGNNWRVKLQSQTQQSKLAAAHLNVERRGRFSTLGITIANPNLVAKSGVLVGHYLRRVTEKLDIGAELVYQRDRQIPGSQYSVLSYALRYFAQNWTATATFNSSTLHACYYHKQTPNLQFGVEFESNFRVGESCTTLAYQVDVPEADMTLRASCDTNWTVAAVMEKKLSQQVPFSLALSGMLNHAKNEGKFGIGFVVG
ncbi:Mitochondrial import receptor subunit TOM40-like protein [Aphelenchoides besseyi]|nr:Mitochondrial import receptor subunit TOM40-like protein [Aphelenchoides besseyi]KAI6228395.1 Mitochondrial import receptor subunit TOM40-like protein [Aphelenchoides besseyi]